MVGKALANIFWDSYRIIFIAYLVHGHDIALRVLNDWTANSKLGQSCFQRDLKPRTTRDRSHTRYARL